MDLSKLPRLSETDRHAPAPPPETTSEQRPPAPTVTSAPEAWISVAVGALLLLMYPRFLQWVSSRIFGTHFNEFMRPDGTVVPYPQVPAFWGDLGPTSFGIVLVFEGLVLALVPRARLIWAAFALTVVVTAYNLIYLVMSYSTYGLPIMSALAVIFGIYIAMHQWSLLKASRSEFRA